MSVGKVFEWVLIAVVVFIGFRWLVGLFNNTTQNALAQPNIYPAYAPYNGGVVVMGGAGPYYGYRYPRRYSNRY